MRIPGLRGLPPGRVARRVVEEYLEDDLLTYAAALSYHLLFALFPFLLFLLALLGFLNLQDLFDRLLAQAQGTLPPEAMEQVTTIVSEIRDGREGGLLSIGIASSVWIASVGMRSTMNALNRAYDIGEGRSRWKRYWLSVVYTLAFALLIVLATAVLVVTPLVVRRFGDELGMGAALVTAWGWIAMPAALVIAMLAVSLVYHFAPNLDQRFRFITPGSVVAVLLWLLVSVGFRFYVDNFGNYEVTYGSIGAVIILLLYFFLSSALLLLGGEVNAVIREDAPRAADPRPARGEEGEPVSGAPPERPARRRRGASAT